MNQAMRVFVLLAGFTMTAACGDANVQIHYEQVANFYTFSLSSDSSSSTSAGNGMFIMYRLNKIENTDTNAKKFEFSTFKISTLTDDKESNEGVSAENILLGGQRITTLTVAAGQTLTEPGGLGCFLKNALTDDPEALANTSALVPLLYNNGDPEQEVSSFREPGNTSVALVSNALPNPLQQLCNTAN